MSASDLSRLHSWDARARDDETYRADDETCTVKKSATRIVA